MDLTKKPFYLNEKQIKWVKETLNGLSVEKKIGQLFHLITYTSDEGYILYLTEKLGIGGCMMRVMDIEELCLTTNNFQKHSEIPMLLSANLEAGFNGVCTTGTKVGCQMALAATSNNDYVKKQCEIIAKEANACGINYSFAPIIDIDYNWLNPITNTRTYGSNPELVAKFGATYVEELQKRGLATAIKHFPGDGRDFRDQHLVASVNDLSCEDWMNSYGKAYKESIDAGALTVMVGHIMQPKWSKRLNPELKDSEIKPALIAKELLNGLLRDKLGFNGLIITDSSTMAGMGTAVPRSIGVPLTIASGCDMFLFSKNLEEDYMFMKKGVEDGIISSERLDEAVTRILALKASLNLPEKKENGQLFVDVNKAKKIVGSEKHKTIAKEVADNSITLVKEESGVLPINNQKYKKVLVYGLNTPKSLVNVGQTHVEIGDIIKEEFSKRGYEATLYSPKPGFEGMVDPVAEIIDNYDLIVYAASYKTKSNQTSVRIEWSEPFGANVPVYMYDVKTIFISFENPYHLADVPRVKTYINTYGDSKEIIDSLFNKLEGKESFNGKSPVDAFCGLWDAYL